MVTATNPHHGELREDGPNLADFLRGSMRPVPTRVLQYGPCDFCRVALRAAESQNVYEIIEGGEPVYTQDGAVSGLVQRLAAHRNGRNGLLTMDRLNRISRWRPQRTERGREDGY